MLDPQAFQRHLVQRLGEAWVQQVLAERSLQGLDLVPSAARVVLGVPELAVQVGPPSSPPDPCSRDGAWLEA